LGKVETDLVGVLGYYTRVASFRKCISTFIDNGGKQIIALGAGFDTNFFHFSVCLSFAGTLELSNPNFLIYLYYFLPQDTLPDDFKYLELDFPQVVSMKSSILQKQPKFSKFIQGAQITGPS
jgi:hypothetical protein